MSSRRSLETASKKAGYSKGVCVFCGSSDLDENIYGKLIISKGGMSAHYFCMLFSSGLSQNGRSETEGIFGFLHQDIVNEVKRASRLKCFYCKKGGATIGCVVKNCRRTFHLGCGRNNSTLHLFYDTFCSYCPLHRLQQNVSASDDSNITCPICVSPVEGYPSSVTLRAPCCKTNWYHRDCVQSYATSAGIYFFKCPTCNNKDDFQQEMLSYGIYIPDQDASWETEPDAYQELLQRYSHCDAKSCQCVEGRKYDVEGSKWEIMVCSSCGSRGSHKACSYLLKKAKKDICPDCKVIDDQVKKKKQLLTSPPSKRRSLELMKLEDCSGNKQGSMYPGPSLVPKKKGLPKCADHRRQTKSPSSSASQFNKEYKRSSTSAGNIPAKKRHSVATETISSLHSRLENNKNSAKRRLSHISPSNLKSSKKNRKSSEGDGKQMTLLSWLNHGHRESGQESNSSALEVSPTTSSYLPSPPQSPSRQTLISCRGSPRKHGLKKPFIMEWRGKELVIKSPRVVLRKNSRLGKMKPKALDIDMNAWKEGSANNWQVELLSSIDSDVRVTRTIFSSEQKLSRTGQSQSLKKPKSHSASRGSLDSRRVTRSPTKMTSLSAHTEMSVDDNIKLERSRDLKKQRSSIRPVRQPAGSKVSCDHDTDVQSEAHPCNEQRMSRSLSKKKKQKSAEITVGDDTVIEFKSRTSAGKDASSLSADDESKEFPRRELTPLFLENCANTEESNSVMKVQATGELTPVEKVKYSLNSPSPANGDVVLTRNSPRLNKGKTLDPVADSTVKKCHGEKCNARKVLIPGCSLNRYPSVQRRKSRRHTLSLVLNKTLEDADSENEICTCTESFTLVKDRNIIDKPILSSQEKTPKKDSVKQYPRLMRGVSLTPNRLPSQYSENTEAKKLRRRCREGMSLSAPSSPCLGKSRSSCASLKLQSLQEDMCKRLTDWSCGKNKSSSSKGQQSGDRGKRQLIVNHGTTLNTVSPVTKKRKCESDVLWECVGTRQIFEEEGKPTTRARGGSPEKSQQIRQEVDRENLCPNVPAVESATTDEINLQVNEDSISLAHLKSLINQRIESYVEPTMPINGCSPTATGLRQKGQLDRRHSVKLPRFDGQGDRKSNSGLAIGDKEVMLEYYYASPDGRQKARRSSSVVSTSSSSSSSSTLSSTGMVEIDVTVD